MAKKTAFCCQSCGAIHFKWMGRCTDCGSWNSLIEEFAEGGASHFSRINESLENKASQAKNYETGHDSQGEGGNFQNLGFNKSASRKTNKIDLLELNGPAAEFLRIETKISEFDRVLGGGLVRASVVLIGGDPGIGKSTLLLQTAFSLAANQTRIIYITGEESIDQVRLRARRLFGNLNSDEKSPANSQKNQDFNQIKLASSTNVAEIIGTLREEVKKSTYKKENQDLATAEKSSKNPSKTTESQPIVVIIDSIQTMFLDQLSSAPGTVSQVRACAAELTNFAKNYNLTLLIVSHVTKDGQIAGPKVLEHMVDTVLYFEGEKDLNFRILRAIKNRFGAANEIGVFEMNETGLSEVLNPSELFLSSYERKTSGTSVFAGIEGTRPVLAEIQALIAPSFIPNPRRAVVGWDTNRLAMVIAILNNRYGLNLFDKEVYLNIVGGLKIVETAADLAVACSLISSAKDIALPSTLVAIGELGLSGEVRMVSGLETRIREAEKLGFKTALIPAANQKQKNFPTLKNSLSKIELIAIGHIRDLARFFQKN